jgi:tRNA modification GTPase
MEAVLARPAAERLRDGIRVAVAGPPNSGKSSLVNYLAERDVAITSAIPGTTRDLLEAPIALEGVPFVLVDTAGLRDADEEIERIGIQRAEHLLATADIILWLGDPLAASVGERTIIVQSKADLDPVFVQGADVLVSSASGSGMDQLVAVLTGKARQLLPAPGEVTINARHREHITTCLSNLKAASLTRDLLIAAEHLRMARLALDRITGRSGVEDMLNALFGRFCIGK